MGTAQWLRLNQGKSGLISVCHARILLHKQDDLGTSKAFDPVSGSFRHGLFVYLLGPHPQTFIAVVITQP